MNIIKMESALAFWITDCKKKNIPLNCDLVCEKARELYQQVTTGNDAEEPNQGPSTAPVHADFLAIKGWFDRFQKRFIIISLDGEATSADQEPV